MKGKPLDMPCIETPNHWITMGFDEDLNAALEQARAEAAKFIAEQRRVSPEVASQLMRDVSDCRVSQVVNAKKGEHRLNLKLASVLKANLERPERQTARYYVTSAYDADPTKLWTRLPWR